ncbi:hypothetical protein XM38_048460 [Halomicronema hongdechloris C2206]|uniref:Uncharacterized protein n=1 Tax=Halomicronema hongdechloris C2206 TaxID=1641165 RepID=A0A1Z3HUD2_9CYAN|nr:hypothetical protein XM38_048460 [Halomicronema hongdechloris C2206]
MELRKTNETLMEQVTLLRDTLRSHLNWHGVHFTASPQLQLAARLPHPQPRCQRCRSCPL